MLKVEELRNLSEDELKANRQDVVTRLEAAHSTLVEQEELNGELQKRATLFADLLNEPHDLDVIRKFLLLIDHYGIEEVEKASRITARFKPHFALRTVNYTAGILRNWSLGIRK